jgi:hypothetical protein
VNYGRLRVRTTSSGKRYRIVSIEDAGPDDPPEVQGEAKITIENEGESKYRIVYVPKRPLLP